MQSSLFLRLGAVLLAAPALPGAALAQPPAAVNPLATARTIQVHETLIWAGTSDASQPTYGVDVQIVRPDKIKEVVTYSKSARVDQYVQDSKVEYQYDGASKKYLTSPLPADGVSTTEICGLTLVKLLLSGGYLAPLNPGSKRTTTKQTINGREMTLLTEIDLGKVPSDPTLKAVTHLWTDAKTGLPYRLLITLTRKGVAKTYHEVTFSRWILNKPIAAARLAWIPPAGSSAVKSGASSLLAIGTPAPDFTATAPDGRKVHLSDYKGKIVVLDFWATWCGPCQKSMPALEKVYQQVKDKDVVVLGLCSWDQKAAYDKWLTTKGTAYTFQTAYDPAGHGNNSIAGSLYKVSAIPAQYVIDKNGKVAAAYSGYGDGDTRLEKALAAQGVTVQAVAAAAVTKAP